MERAVVLNVQQLFAKYFLSERLGPLLLVTLAADIFFGTFFAGGKIVELTAGGSTSPAMAFGIHVAVHVTLQSLWWVFAWNRLGPMREFLKDGQAAPELEDYAQWLTILLPISKTVVSGMSLVVTVALVGHVSSWPATGFFLAAFILGTLAVVGPMFRWGLLPIRTRLASASPHPEVSLRFRGAVGVEIATVTILMTLAAMCLVVSFSIKIYHDPLPMQDFILAIFGLIVATIAGSALSATLLARTFTEPLSTIRDTVDSIVEQGHMIDAERIPIRRNDEVGDLVNGINTMIDRLSDAQRERRKQRRELEELNASLERRVAQRTAELADSLEELRETQKQLVESARYAGMAEVATGVLHNVGNVINSINVSADVAQRTLQKSSLDVFGKIASLLAEKEATGGLAEFLDTPRGRKLPESLLAVEKRLKSEHDTVGTELDRLRERVRHTMAVIDSQQEYARTVSLDDEIDVAEFLDKAVDLAGTTLHTGDVEVRKRYGCGDVVNVDPHRLLQIVVNVLSNARHAVADNPPGERLVDIDTRVQNDRLTISVTDNGVGIPPEHLNDIFRHGFTTKPNGHGFGLHSSANAAKQLGGNLIAHSDGPGRGATFDLVLPLQPTSKPCTIPTTAS